MREPLEGVPPRGCCGSPARIDMFRVIVLDQGNRSRASRDGPRLLAPTASSAAVRATMKGNRSRDTRAEIAIRSALHRRGLRFRVNVAPEPQLRCRADIVFRRAKIAVFVDGCFWHRCPVHGTSPRTNSAYWTAKLDRNIARDRRQERDLKEAGWRVLRFWEHEAPELAAEAVARCVRERAPTARSH
jgi:DNA mismatch endonuclease, patch repair protein